MPAVIWKQITPGRLQPDAFRLEVLNELRKVAKLVKKDYEKTTRTWKHKPKFTEDIHLPKGTPSVEVGTDDEIYGYVTKGTKPHIITPRAPGGVLAFQDTYTAKTMPGVIDSRAGGKSGAMVFTRLVHHPGTEAREFDETIAEKWEPLFEEFMQAALDRGAAKCGHKAT